VSPIVPFQVYAAKNNNKEELLASSSGGLFIAIAKKVIADGGVVFGARFDSKWSVIHSYADTLEGVKNFMGSKYVQSRIGKTFSEAKGFLKERRKVLFTGTSCQIAALKNFLQKDYDNLLTIDVICHGVPSPMVWRRYLDELKENAHEDVKKNTVLLHSKPHIFRRDAPLSKNNYEIKSISFRDKRLGWKKISFALTLAKALADGKQNSVSLSHIYSNNPYMKLFLNDYILRPSCYQCPVKGGRSQSDITIADYWGIEDQHPEIDEVWNGIGLLITNTRKGEEYIKGMPLALIPSTLEAATVSNQSYYFPKNEPKQRNLVFKKLSQGVSVDYLAYDLLRIPLRLWIIQKCKRKIKSIMDKMLNR